MPNLHCPACDKEYWAFTNTAVLDKLDRHAEAAHSPLGPLGSARRKATSVSDGITESGFNWGPMVVQRITEYRGRRVLRVSGAGRNAVEIVMSPQGNNFEVRQRDYRGNWWKLEREPKGWGA